MEKEVCLTDSSSVKNFTYCPPISKKEFWFPLVLGIIICIVGSFPYIYGKSLENEKGIFMGMVGRGTAGSFGYIMFQRQAWEGKWWFTNQCTPDSPNNSYFNIEWWLLGSLARIASLSVLEFFHVDRCFSIFLFLFSIYYFLALILDTIPQRRFVLLLITTGSGLGWLLRCLNSMFYLSLPLSWDMEGIQILSYLICKPHFIRSITLAVLMYTFLIRGFQTGKVIFFILCGIMALLHSLMRPYLIPESYIMFILIPLLFCIMKKKLEWKWFRLCAIPAIIHFPAILYYFWVSLSDALGMSGWAENHQFMGKPGFLIEYILGIGWTWLVCMIFFIYLVRKCQERISFLVILMWILVAWGICNLYPYWKPGQESGLYAFIIAPPILTIIGPYQWISNYFTQNNAIRNKIFHFLLFLFSQKLLLATLIILISIPTTAFVYYSMFRDLKYGHPQWSYFLSRDAHYALEYLIKNGKENDVVIASPKTSPFIFALTPCRTVTGHFMLTKDYVKKTEDVVRFFKHTQLPVQEEILQKYRVRYIFVGPYEREFVNRDIEIKGTYIPVVDKKDTKLYLVPEHPEKDK